jgi:hypothetical protein
MYTERDIDSEQKNNVITCNPPSNSKFNLCHDVCSKKERRIQDVTRRKIPTNFRRKKKKIIKKNRFYIHLKNS